MARAGSLRPSRFEGIRRSAALWARRAAIALVAAGGVSCAPGGLQAPSIVNSVRILASEAEPPYVAPGAPVTLKVLAVDERPSRPSSMQLYWLNDLCEDPASDAYYNCFGGILGASDGGAGGGPGADAGPGNAAEAGAGGIPFGVDLTNTPYVTLGDPNDQAPPCSSSTPCSSFTTSMPIDVITRHSSASASAGTYGLGIVFNVACAGHLEFVQPDPNNTQSPPIGCFDAQENRLGPNDYVIGFTRVYAYDADAGITNDNPVIDHIDHDGTPLDPQAVQTNGIMLQACGARCSSTHIGPVVPPSSQETNTQAVDSNGNPLKEQIYADFYTTIGSFSSDARLLYDPTTGSVGSPSDTDNEFTPPTGPAEGTMWIVVHDNRGGATWVTIPLHVK